MNIQQRQGLLIKIYDIHDEFASDAKSACDKGCSACCTCNVTATTLEGLMMYDHFIHKGLEDRLQKIMAARSALRFQPKLTINEMVALCAKGEDLPEENNDPSAGICDLLDEDACTIYPVRPFGCRAMLSALNCSMGGEAQMSPFMLSVNNVVMQYIEAVDQPGGTGNLIDVLRALSVESFREAYKGGTAPSASPGLLANRPFPVLMVPPEHRQSIQPLIQSLNDAVREFQSPSSQKPS